MQVKNGNFETETFSDWRTIGNNSIETNELGIDPSEGTYQALISNGAGNSGNAVSDGDLETFLGLAPGIFDNLGNGDVTEGSAIKQTFTLEAGDVLTFDWNFLTNEEATSESDFAFFSLTSLTTELADADSPSLIETSTEDFSLETGYQTTSIGISESGTYTLSLGVVDVGDDSVDSALLVDDIQIGFDDEVTNPDSEFDIEFNFLDDNLTPAQREVFEDAANRWSEIIVGDLPDVVFEDLGLVDDLLIDAGISPIDGSGGILGQAGPTIVRTDSFLPARGIMEFDIADVEDLETQGLLDEVILHEMGHVLGIGTIWEPLDLLTDTESNDPRFIGTGATEEYNAIFGVDEFGVPVEADGGLGTALGHWDEEVFDNELMTGFINFGDNPLSRVTAASAGDLGYEVNVDAADIYVPPSIAESTTESVSHLPVMNNTELQFVDPVAGDNNAISSELEFV